MVPLWLLILLSAGVVLGKEVCYDKIGCFSNERPWSWTEERPISRLPWSPQQIQAKFLLHTRENPVDFQVLDAFNESSISASNFKASRKSRFIIHGFINSGEGSWLTDMCTAILTVEDVNCFCVDWRKGAFTLYTQAANNVRVVGAVIAYFIDTLVNTAGYSPSDVYLIGHSLGAQAAGEAGKRRPGVSRITGLSPAGPYFQGTPPEVRLDPTDADFVDVIHTDTSSLIAHLGFKGFGTSQLLGNLDFFPNGGKTMPGCEFHIPFLFHPDDLWHDGENFIACDHLRSYKYFTESITNPEGFFGFLADAYDHFQMGAGFPCPDTGCPSMGYYADKYAGITAQNKVFYLDTLADSPYASWRYMISVKEHSLLALFKDSQITIHGSLGETKKDEIHGGHIYRDHNYVTYLDLAVYVGDVHKMVFTFKHRLPGSLPSPLTSISVSIQSGKDGKLYKVCGNESRQENALTLPFC
uniref:Triacylglycerol lipase n=1 Tax=Leptobrachium leishanense TaxID=445787 RepID=A0A8C5WI63_9ANUR